MATLKDLKVSISEMHFDEAVKLVQEIRRARRIASREKPLTKTTKPKADKKPKQEFSADRAAALLKKLEGMRSGS